MPSGRSSPRTCQLAARAAGRPRVWPVRRIVEAILYLDQTGCAWRYLPADFPPWQTVYGYFADTAEGHPRLG